MSPYVVALVASPGTSRTQIAKYLRESGYEVFECEDLAITSSFAGVVLLDDDPPRENVHTRVRTWLRMRRLPRIVIVSSRPAGWKPLSLRYVDHLFVIPAPSFGWEIVDALRATQPLLPRV